MRLADATTGSVIEGALPTYGGLEYSVLPEIDVPGMSARFRICTARKDHQGDIIEPSGVDWEDYRYNPVVKFEHGFSGIPWPVARSADESGVLHQSWEPDEDAIYARAFFSEKHELSEQCFGLIVDGFMRAASIHVMPVPGKFKALGHGDNAGHHVFESSEMEWSVATVAVNPDAYAKSLSADSKLSEVLALQLESANRILESGRVGGRPLLPSLAKCLNAVKPPKQPLVRGHSTTGEESMGTKSLTQPEVDQLGAVGLAKALAAVSEYDAESHKRLISKAKSLEYAKADSEEYDNGSLAKVGPLEEEEVVAPKAEEPGDSGSELADTEVPAPSAMSPGADFLTALHATIGELCAKLDSVSQYTEKPEVQELAKQLCDSIRTEMAAIEGAFSSIYPDEEPLVAVEEPADVEMVKSWVAANARAGFQPEGLATRLARAAQNPAKAKSAIQATVRDLRLLNSQAKSWKPAKSEAYATQEEFDALSAAVSKLIEAVASQPARV